MLIRTVEELEALPRGAIVRTFDGGMFHRGATCFLGAASGEEYDYQTVLDRGPLHLIYPCCRAEEKKLIAEEIRRQKSRYYHPALCAVIEEMA